MADFDNHIDEKIIDKDNIDHLSSSKKDNIDHLSSSKKDNIDRLSSSKKDNIDHAASFKKEIIDHEALFRQTLDKRKKLKQHLYIKVSLTGFIISIISFSIFCGIWAYYKPIFSDEFDSIVVLSVFFRVVGICIFSIVPTKEFDIIKSIAESKNPVNRQCFFILASIGWALWGCFLLRTDIVYHAYVKTMLQVIPPFLMSLWCMWLFIKNESRYVELLIVTQLIFIYVMYDIAMGPFYCIYYDCLPLLKVGDGLFGILFIYSSYKASQSYRQVKKAFERIEEDKRIIKEEQDKLKSNKDEEALTTQENLEDNRYMKPRRSIEEVREDKKTIDSYDISLVYYLIYNICVVLGPWCILVGLEEIVYNKSPIRSIFWFLQALCDLMPLFIVGILGNDYCFNLCARIFEFDVKRQQEDGAFMAALVSMCEVHPCDENKHEVLWIYRKPDIADCSRHLKNIKKLKFNNEINRTFWIKAVIEKYHEQYFDIRVDYQDDMNLELRYRYDYHDDDGVVLTTVKKLGTVSTTENECSFTSWVKYFELLNENTSLEKIEALKIVRFKYPRTVSDTESKKDKVSNTSRSNYWSRSESYSVVKSSIKSSNNEKELHSKIDEMLKWGRKNLRKFDGRNFFIKSDETCFRSNLFTSSPRDLSTDDKKEFFNLSKKVVVNKANHRFDKIDYFISHSWNDHAKSKCKGMEAFIERCNNSGKPWPSFWLDKVCIDQNDNKRGIASLPINIGACKKILILMGKTYMTRLWCIWELFMLFTFCNKELGLERMQIICIDKNIDVVEAIENFDINKAHAFDPNEEYRLRYIMLDVIGKDTVVESFKHMVNLVHQGKVSTIDYKPKLKKVKKREDTNKSDSSNS